MACPEDAGFILELDKAMKRAASVRMMQSEVKTNEKRWIVAHEQPLDLLFVKRIFTELHRREAAMRDDLPEGKISVEAFQMSLERLFYLLGDPDPFEAEWYARGAEYVEWGHFFQVYRSRNVVVRLSVFERIFLTMDNADSSILAGFVSNFILLVILVSSLAFIFSTMPECKIAQGSSLCHSLKNVELGCLLLFILEYLLRVCTCWAVRGNVVDQGRLLELVVGHEAIDEGNPVLRLLYFVVAPANLIDAAAILPGVVSRLFEVKGGAFVVLRLVRLTRIFRAFKSPAMSEAVRVISKTMQQSIQALYILAFNLALGIVIFGSLMYMAEGGPELNALGAGGEWNETTLVFDRVVGYEWDAGSQAFMPVKAESVFQSIPQACWWAMVTVTTVGYGDQSPTTSLGKLVGVGTMLFSLVILALPVGVIGGTFSSVWEACDLERRAQDEQLKEDKRTIASELVRLDPWAVSRLVLIEVWNDLTLPLDSMGRPPPSSFLGVGKVQLTLPPHERASGTCTAELRPDPGIVKRKITGRVTIEYEWVPHRSDAESLDAQEVSAPLRWTTTGRHLARTLSNLISMRASSASNDNDIHSADIECDVSGRLKVTLVSAEDLVCARGAQSGVTNPYCLVLCYPSHNQVGHPEPCIWRTPTAWNEATPQWDAVQCFNWKWILTIVECGCAGGSTDSRDSRGLGDECSAERKSSVEAASSAICSEESAVGSSSQAEHVAKAGELAALISTFEASLLQQQDELRQLRRAVICAASGCSPDSGGLADCLVR